MTTKLILRIANLIVFPLTIITGLMLTAGGLAPFVHPSYSSWLPLFGLSFPFLFVLNLVWLIYWWIQLRFKMIFPLCFLVLNLIHISKYFQYSREQKVKGERTVKIATYNTQLFGTFQDTNYFGNAIQFLRNNQYGILCMQEFYSQKNLAEKLDAIKKEGGFQNWTFYRLQQDRPYGMAIFSKFKILASGKIGLGKNTGNMAIWADMLVNGDTLRVYNLHLQSIRFNKADYAFINNRGDESSGLKSSKNLINRLREAYLKRAEQADSVALHMNGCRHRRIVMGDINDVPLSYTYNRISNGMLDAFRESGNGFEKTYRGPFPNFRIDYIFTSKDIPCYKYRSTDKVPGDHRLVECLISP